jgi:hypothetical protein
VCAVQWCAQRPCDTTRFSLLLLTPPSDVHLLHKHPSFSIVTCFFRPPSEGVMGDLRKDPFDRKPFRCPTFEHDLISDLMSYESPDDALGRSDPDAMPRVNLGIIRPNSRSLGDRLVSPLVDRHPNILHGSAIKNPSPVEFPSCQVPLQVRGFMRLKVTALQDVPVADELAEKHQFFLHLRFGAVRVETFNRMFVVWSNRLVVHVLIITCASAILDSYGIFLVPPFYGYRHLARLVSRFRMAHF